MYTFVTSLALILGSCALAMATDLVALPGQIALPVPDGWILSENSTGFPYRIVDIDDAAELAIFRSVISEDESISNQDDFKESVDSVINSVIMTLPEASMLSSTGLKDDDWASFALEFESWDDNSGTKLRHRLAGVLYRHPEGYQLLFTLWARTTPEAWSVLVDDFLTMQDGFVYQGPVTDDPFAPDGRYDRILLLGLPLLLIGFAQLLRNAAQKRRIEGMRTPTLPRAQRADDSGSTARARGDGEQG